MRESRLANMRLLVLCVFLAVCSARIYERCELAREMLQLGVEREHLGTWVCIAFHESRFDTAARNPYSGDHGLLQISELYWCGNGKACGLPCADLRDDNIEDDVKCAQLVHEEHTRLQGDGFLAWVVYPQHCKHNTKKYLVDCDLTKDEKENLRIKNATFKILPKIDDLRAPYLSINSLIRSNDFKQEKAARSNWLNFKVDNIDELKLPVLTNERDKPIANTRRVYNIITDDDTSRKALKPAYANTPKREPASFDRQYGESASHSVNPLTESQLVESNREPKKLFQTLTKEKGPTTVKETQVTTSPIRDISTININYSKSSRLPVPLKRNELDSVDSRNVRQYPFHPYQAVSEQEKQTTWQSRRMPEVFRPVSDLLTTTRLRDTTTEPVSRYYNEQHRTDDELFVPNKRLSNKLETTTRRPETTIDDSFEIYLNTRKPAFTKYSFAPFTGRHVRLSIFNDGSTTPLPSLSKTRQSPENASKKSWRQTRT